MTVALAAVYPLSFLLRCSGSLLSVHGSLLPAVFRRRDRRESGFTPPPWERPGSLSPWRRRFVKRKPESFIFVSTTTSTGLDRIRFLQNSAGERTVDFSFLAPFDHPFIARRFIKSTNPSTFILVETEIWPGLLSSIQSLGIPVTIINGKLGPGSFRRYNLFRFAIRSLLSEISLVCVQSKTFARRFHWLGVPRERIEVLGNIKFDSMPDSSQFDCPEIRRNLGLPEKAGLFVAGKHETRRGGDPRPLFQNSA